MARQPRQAQRFVLKRRSDLVVEIPLERERVHELGDAHPPAVERPFVRAEPQPREEATVVGWADHEPLAQGRRAAVFRSARASDAVDVAGSRLARTQLRFRQSGYVNVTSTGTSAVFARASRTEGSSSPYFSRSAPALA